MCVELGRETVTMMTSAGGCWSVDTTTVRSRRGDSGTLETTVVRPGAPLTDPVLRWDIIFLIKIIMQHQGWGPCVSDAECEDSSNGYTLCSTSCLDRSYFPLDKFPLAAAVYGYGPGDKCCRQDQIMTEVLVSSTTSSVCKSLAGKGRGSGCRQVPPMAFKKCRHYCFTVWCDCGCRRRCYPHDKCADGVIGCETSSDCQDGLECVGSGADRKCSDINECSDIRFSDIVANHCGDNAVCDNLVGGYQCLCVTGKRKIFEKSTYIKIIFFVRIWLLDSRSRMCWSEWMHGF